MTPSRRIDIKRDHYYDGDLYLQISPTDYPIEEYGIPNSFTLRWESYGQAGHAEIAIRDTGELRSLRDACNAMLGEPADGR